MKKPTCEGMNETAPHREWHYRRCGLVGYVSLEMGFEISEVQANSSVSLSSFYLLFFMENSQLPPQYHVCLCVMITMD